MEWGLGEEEGMKGLGIWIGGLFFFLRKEGGRGVMWKGIGKKMWSKE